MSESITQNFETKKSVENAHTHINECVKEESARLLEAFEEKKEVPEHNVNRWRKASVVGAATLIAALMATEETEMHNTDTEPRDNSRVERVDAAFESYVPLVVEDIFFKERGDTIEFPDINEESQTASLVEGSVDSEIDSRDEESPEYIREIVEYETPEELLVDAERFIGRASDVRFRYNQLQDIFGADTFFTFDMLMLRIPQDLALLDRAKILVEKENFTEQEVAELQNISEAHQRRWKEMTEEEIRQLDTFTTEVRGFEKIGMDNEDVERALETIYSDRWLASIDVVAFRPDSVTVAVRTLPDSTKVSMYRAGESLGRARSLSERGSVRDSVTMYAVPGLDESWSEERIYTYIKHLMNHESAHSNSPTSAISLSTPERLDMLYDVVESFLQNKYNTPYTQALKEMLFEGPGEEGLEWPEDAGKMFGNHLYKVISEYWAEAFRYYMYKKDLPRVYIEQMQRYIRDGEAAGEELNIPGVEEFRFAQVVEPLVEKYYQMITRQDIDDVTIVAQHDK